MKRDGKPSDKSEADGRRPSARCGSSPNRKRGFVERATAAQGHSGHGAESVRPHLRDQLRLKALMPSPYPLPEAQYPGKDEHHR